MKNIFESFNARYLSIEQVTKSFVPTNDYENLLMSAHSILMGPRGCGKTTLFKMLTPRAISEWNEKNEENKIEMKFFGIYIPADKQWDRQLKNFQMKFDGMNHQMLITKSVITSNILYSIIDTFQDLLSVYIENEQDMLDYQACISAQLIDVWALNNVSFTSFSEIKKCIKLRIRDINTLINKIEFGFATIEDHKFDDYYFHEYMDLASNAFDIFETVLKDLDFVKGKSIKWALCFDELEIVPTWVIKDIITHYLRSTNQKVLFKLATAPIINWKDEYQLNEVNSSAQDSQDFVVIRSWVYNYQSRKDWEVFCEKFIINSIDNNIDSVGDLKKIFGEHNLNNALLDSEITLRKEIKDKNSPDFKRGSLMYLVTKKLAQQDKTFYDFLQTKGIDPLDPQPSGKADIDSIFRKIKYTIVYRYYFYKRSNIRSRKTISLYHGYPFVTELTDGNPRALVNILSTFLNKQQVNFDTLNLIPLKSQGRIIQEFSSDFFMQITNHPDAAKRIMIKGEVKILTLKSLIECIGEWFYKRLIKEPFKMDSINCFNVDKDVDKSIIELIKLAVDMGALQFLVKNKNVILTKDSIVNSKFRLSYILCPHFRLPKRSDSSVNLSRILNESLFKHVQRADNQQKQIKWGI